MAKVEISRSVLLQLAGRLWRGWLRPIGLMLLIMAPLRSAVVDWNWVPSGSMKPTIVEGDLVLINKLAYDLRVPFTTARVAKWAEPQRGDITVCFSPDDGTRLVKRVIGLPGDRIELRQNVVFINGQAQSYTLIDPAPYQRDVFEDSRPVVAIEHLDSAEHLVMALPSRPALRTTADFVVPDGEYFLLGDSRDNSRDSRVFGPVPREQITGRAHTVLLSFDRQRWLLPRFGRIGQSLSAM
jgi:signal peptidase I